MSQSRNGAAQGSAAGATESRAAKIAQRGIRTANDLAGFASGMIHDALSGAVGNKEGNLACRAGGLLIRTTELRFRHGQDREIQLVEETTEINDPVAEELAALDAQQAELNARRAQLQEASQLRK